METETIDSEGNSVRQTGRQLCKQLSHSHSPNFIDSLSMHKIQIHHCTYLEKCGSRLEFQCQWFLWHISIESSVLVVAVVEVIIVVVGGGGSDGKSECGLIIVYVIQLLFSVAIALKSNFPTSQEWIGIREFHYRPYAHPQHASLLYANENQNEFHKFDYPRVKWYDSVGCSIRSQWIATSNCGAFKYIHYLSCSW